MNIKSIAIDLAKETFHICAVDTDNNLVIDKKVKRKSLLSTIVKLTPVDIYMEACGGAHYWARKFVSLGHNVKLIAPHRVTPYVGGQKNDRNDAIAILEACRRPGVVFVGIKTIAQQDLKSLHKIRDQKLKNQTALINQIRGYMLEYGVVLPKTHSKFKSHIEGCLEDATNELSPKIRELCKLLFEDYLYTTKRLDQLTGEIKEISSKTPVIRGLAEEVTGVGLLVASRFYCSVGNINRFKNGRQVAAWVGLVPKQHSTGGKTRLGRITKHGDRDLRKIIVQGARSAVISATMKKQPDAEELKIQRLVKEKGFNIASVAVANRNTRQMCAVMKKLEECA